MNSSSPRFTAASSPRRRSDLAVRLGVTRDAPVGGHLSCEVHERVASVDHRAALEPVHEVLDILELIVAFRLSFLRDGFRAGIRASGGRASGRGPAAS